jgi:hypothetical protein
LLFSLLRLPIPVIRRSRSIDYNARAAARAIIVVAASSWRCEAGLGKTAAEMVMTNLHPEPSRGANARP